MNIKKLLISIVVIIMVLGIIFTLVMPQVFNSAPVTPITSSNEAPRNDVANPNADLSLATTTQNSNANNISDLIIISSPAEDSKVTSPLTISGKARGSWYFEGTFPVVLINDRTGLQIAKGTAKAEGSWMTENFVPFTAELTFTQPATSTPAHLILSKDNPSGLAANDASTTISLIVK